jgi:hypothetical protein
LRDAEVLARDISTSELVNGIQEVPLFIRGQLRYSLLAEELRALLHWLLCNRFGMGISRHDGMELLVGEGPVRINVV